MIVTDLRVCLSGASIFTAMPTLSIAPDDLLHRHEPRIPALPLIFRTN
jgi:hypothetical protein